MAAKSVNITDFSTLPGRLIDLTTYTFPPIITNTTDKRKKLIYEVIVKIVNGANHGDFIDIESKYFNSQCKLPKDAIGWIKVDSRFENNPQPKKSAVTLVLAGKNVGKKNETNVFTQALRDALSIYNKQLKHAVGNMPDDVAAAEDADIPESNVEMHPPMLAQIYHELKKPLDFTGDIYEQRKYNGVRAVAMYIERPHPHVVLYSRGRGIFPGVPYICDELLPVLTKHPSGRLDGELYIHGTPLQIISGAARGSPEDNARYGLQYHVYDYFDIEHLDMKFSERHAILSGIFADRNQFRYCTPVETIKLHSHEREAAEAEIDTWYKRWLAEGYEGAMLRTNTPYRFSTNKYHSNNLLKIKPLNDDEFTIVGIDAGVKGKALGAVLFVFETNVEPKKQFTVTPMGEIEWRKKYYTELTTPGPDGKTIFETKYLGKKMRVHYEELSSDGVPLRARILDEYLRPDDE